MRQINKVIKKFNTLGNRYIFISWIVGVAILLISAEILCNVGMIV
jgi:hypothetical protein